jgi:uncharacterized protein (DUF1786 family)
MGGGAINRAIQHHVEAGLAVTATPAAARTLNDDLSIVESWGIDVSKQPQQSAVCLQLGDIEAGGIEDLLAAYGLEKPGLCCVAAQDHGEAIGYSDREHRFEYWKRFLDRGGMLSDLVYTEPPAGLTRLKAIRRQWPTTLVMDTGTAAVWGALSDERVQRWSSQGVTIVNVGNGHTLGALVKDRRIWGLFEEHTSNIDRFTLRQLVLRLQQGSLTNEYIFERGGHGAGYAQDYDPAAFSDRVVVLGPNRRKAADHWYRAAPHGNMMLSGAFGIVDAVLASKTHARDSSKA